MEQVLLVEDVQGIREALKELLEIAGYDVKTAKNGNEGLKAILKYNPSVVICDVYMPELDGFEMLAEMKNYPVSPVFIFLTARVEKQAVIKGMQLGANAYINKPFDHMDLLNTIESQLEKWKMNEVGQEYYLSQDEFESNQPINKTELKDHLSKVHGVTFAERTNEIVKLLTDETSENYQIIAL